MSQTVKVNRLKLMEQILNTIKNIEGEWGDLSSLTTDIVESSIRLHKHKIQKCEKEMFTVYGNGNIPTLETLIKLKESEILLNEQEKLLDVLKVYKTLTSQLGRLEISDRFDADYSDSLYDAIHNQTKKKRTDCEIKSLVEEARETYKVISELWETTKDEVKKHKQTTKQIPDYVPPPKDETCIHNDCDTQHTHDALMKYDTNISYDTNNIVTWSGLIILACVLGYIVIQLGA